jgi:proteasome lid subunit RPN8/RPN11
VLPRRLIIGRRLLQRIVEHCLEEAPLEACGILTGRNGEVRHAYATENARRSPVFYEVDPAQQEAVLRAMEARGEELVGIYHSHPTTPAQPSANDIRMAVHYPEAVRVIISLAGPTDIRAFSIRDGVAHPVAIVHPREEMGQWHDLRRS